MAVAISVVLGGSVGLLSGHFAGWLDMVLMRLIDVKLAFPGILLALVIVTVLGGGLDKAMIAVAIGGLPRYARIVRARVLTLKNQQFVEPAWSLGASDWRIMLRHVLPHTVGPVITLATLGLGTTLLSTAALSFLGLGAQPPTAELGLMLTDARKYVRVAWSLAVFPGIPIMTTVLAINLLGDGVRDAARSGPAAGGWRMNETILWLGDPGCNDASRVGGKAANLSRLARSQRVPPGFCLPARFRVSDADLVAAYRELGARCQLADPAVAVRSSALDEDGSAASFAGQHETFLNVRGVDELVHSVRACLDSLHSERAVAYRRQRGLATHETHLAVLVQQLVPAEASGVVFSANPMNGSRTEAVVTSSWGLGESIVGGTVSPDTYILRKTDLTFLMRHIGRKRRMTVPVPGGTREIEVPEAEQTQAAISDAQCVNAVRLADSLEVEMGWPVDLECAWYADVLYLLQCRPITTLPQKEREP